MPGRRGGVACRVGVCRVGVVVGLCRVGACWVVGCGVACRVGRSAEVGVVIVRWWRLAGLVWWSVATGVAPGGDTPGGHPAVPRVTTSVRGGETLQT